MGSRCALCNGRRRELWRRPAATSECQVVSLGRSLLCRGGRCLWRGGTGGGCAVERHHGAAAGDEGVAGRGRLLARLQAAEVELRGLANHQLLREAGQVVLAVALCSKQGGGEGLQGEGRTVAGLTWAGSLAEARPEANITACCPSSRLTKPGQNRCHVISNDLVRRPRRVEQLCGAGTRREHRETVGDAARAAALHIGWEQLCPHCSPDTCDASFSRLVTGPMPSS